MMGGSKGPWRPLRYAALAGLVIAVACAGIALARANFQGTDGDDVFVAEHGSSTAFLLGGNDSFTGAPGKRRGGVDHVWGGPDDDEIFGKSYDDVLRGNNGADKIDGGSGIDGLVGGRGDDTLTGGPGRDVFRPRRGRDTCLGQLRDRGFPGRCERAKVVKP
jgi:hypothetical protein